MCMQLVITPTANAALVSLDADSYSYGHAKQRTSLGVCSVLNGNGMAGAIARRGMQVQ